jgi:hypothetical protein
MEVIRFDNVEDNEVNTAEVEIVKHWAERNGETIATLRIHKLGVGAVMESGREVRINQTAGCRSAHENVRNHLVMYEEINDKSNRIKKADW